MRKINKLICWIILIIVLAIAIINGILLIKNVVYKEETPDFMGYIPFIMEVNSMEPVLKQYDLIIDYKIDSEENIQVGDIISYKYGDKIITHKISKIIIKDAQKQYIMSGTSDTYASIISYSDMKGKYLFTIPYIGQIIKYTRTPIGFAISVIILTIPFLIIDIIIRLIKLRKINVLKKEISDAISEKEKIEINRKKRYND